MQSDTEPQINPPGVARALGVASNTVYRWIRQGMPHERLGVRLIRCRLSEVRAWLQARSSQSLAGRAGR